jgi:hypothetical protein
VVTDLSGQVRPRVRTMVMNVYAGGFAGKCLTSLADMCNQTIYLKYSQLNNPGPTEIFIFMDEREDYINVGNFWTVMTGFGPPKNPAAYALGDYPGSYHGNAGGFSFTDGHSELHRWRDGRTMPPVTAGGRVWDTVTPTSTPNNRDVEWLQDHSTRPKTP